MFHQTSGIEKSAKCTAATAAFIVMKFGADDDTVAAATGVGETFVGISQHATTAAGEEIRVMMTGISRAKAGGSITRGAWLTSDASGLVVAAAPGAGVNNGCIGLALASGSSGDIIPVLVQPVRIQG